jgi:hypothetical protein
MQPRNRSALLLSLFSTALLQPAEAKDLFIEGAKKTVVFVFASGADGHLIPLGTGFLAGVNISPKAQPDRFLEYFVTARHVVTDDLGRIYGNIFIRLNKRDGGSDFLHLDTTLNKQDFVFTHPDDTQVDLVVIPVALDDAKYDFVVVGESLVLTRDTFKQMEISEGADVFFAGLFLPFIGQGRSYPVIRSGKVALITDERIPWRNGVNKPTEMAELLLLETQSFAGNSGSPVFVTVHSTAQIGRTDLRLIGVMRGTFEQNRPVEAVPNDAMSVAKQNLGIAAVIPAYLLRDILFGAPLKNFRKSLLTPPPKLDTGPPGSH